MCAAYMGDDVVIADAPVDQHVLVDRAPVAERQDHALRLSRTPGGVIDRADEIEVVAAAVGCDGSGALQLRPFAIADHDPRRQAGTVGKGGVGKRGRALVAQQQRCLAIPYDPADLGRGEARVDRDTDKGGSLERQLRHDIFCPVGHQQGTSRPDREPCGQAAGDAVDDLVQSANVHERSSSTRAILPAKRRAANRSGESGWVIAVSASAPGRAERADIFHDLVDRRSGEEYAIDALRHQFGDVFLRDDAAGDQADLGCSGLVEQAANRRQQRQVRARQDADADNRHVLFEGGTGDVGRRAADAGIDDLHAGIQEAAGNHARAYVMAVEADLRDEHALGGGIAGRYRGRHLLVTARLVLSCSNLGMRFLRLEQVFNDRPDQSR